MHSFYPDFKKKDIQRDTHILYFQTRQELFSRLPNKLEIQYFNMCRKITPTNHISPKYLILSFGYVLSIQSFAASNAIRLLWKC